MLKTLQSDDEVLNRLQKYMKSELDPLLRCPLWKGRLISSVEFSTDSEPDFQVAIEHGLQRPFLGWLILRKDADENIFERDQTNSDRLLLLEASGAVTVDLWVF